MNRVDAAREIDAGVHTSMRESGNVKDGGITPITVVATPFSASDRPMTAELCPYRRTQRPCDNTATGAAPAAVSASVNQRPRSGRTPSTDVSDGVVGETRMRSGSPSPVSVSSPVP
jgi:hypothetical protein